MKRNSFRPRRDMRGMLTVNQGHLGGWELSWNPDDESFYMDDEVGGMRFHRFANAVYFARTKPSKNPKR